MFNPVSTAQKVSQIPGAFNSLLKEQPKNLLTPEAQTRATAKGLPTPQSGGAGSAFKQLAGALPEAAGRTLTPEVVRGAFQGAKGLVTGNKEDATQGGLRVERALTNDPVGQIANTALLLKGGGELLDRTGLTENSSKNVNAGIKKVTEPAGYAFGKMADVAGKGMNMAKTAAGGFARVLTGLDKSTVEIAKANPTLDLNKINRTDVGKDVESALNTHFKNLGINRDTLGQEVQSAFNKRSEALKESGAAYQPVRESNSTVKVSKGFLDNAIKDATGVKIKDGKVVAGGESKVRDSADLAKLQKHYDFWKPVFQKGKMTANEFLNYRQDVNSDLAKFETKPGTSPYLKNAGKQMYGRFNEAYRPQIAGLEKIDTEFSGQKGDLKALSKGMVDKNGHLTDTGLAKIAKVTAEKPGLAAQLEKIAPGITKKVRALNDMKDLGKGLVDENGKLTDTGLTKIARATQDRPKLMARLEKISPGISRRIKQLQAAEDLRAVSEKYKVATYAKAAGGVGALLTGVATFNPLLIGGAIAEMVLTNPDNAIKIVQKYSQLAEKSVPYRQALGVAFDKIKTQLPKLLNSPVGQLPGAFSRRK